MLFRWDIISQHLRLTRLIEWVMFSAIATIELCELVSLQAKTLLKFANCDNVPPLVSFKLSVHSDNGVGQSGANALVYSFAWSDLQFTVQ